MENWYKWKSKPEWNVASRGTMERQKGKLARLQTKGAYAHCVGGIKIGRTTTETKREFLTKIQSKSS